MIRLLWQKARRTGNQMKNKFSNFGLLALLAKYFTMRTTLNYNVQLIVDTRQHLRNIKRRSKSLLNSNSLDIA